VHRWLCFILFFFWGPVYADMQAFVGQDTVELVDGTRIECLVVMESPRGLLIIRSDPEKGEDGHRQEFIPASQVKSVTRGVRLGETKAFPTDNELAQKVIQGSGTKTPATSKPVTPLLPTGPIAPATPPVTQKGPAPMPAPAPAKGALASKDLASAYLQRFPALEDAVGQLLGGRSQLVEAMDKALADPAARLEAERMLDLFFQASRPEAVPAKSEKPAAVKPAPQTAKPAPAGAK